MMLRLLPARAAALGEAGQLPYGLRRARGTDVKSDVDQLISVLLYQGDQMPPTERVRCRGVPSVPMTNTCSVPFESGSDVTV